MAQQLGHVALDRKNGKVRWFLRFRGYPKIYSYVAPNGRRIQFPTEPEANVVRRADRKPSDPPEMFPHCRGWLLASQCLESIRADIRHGDTLDIALAPYLKTQGAQHAVQRRWGEFVEARRELRVRVPVTDRRLYDLERVPARGYLDFFEEHGVTALELTSAVLEKWVTWLYHRWPSPPEGETRPEPKARADRRRNWRKRAQGWAQSEPATKPRRDWRKRKRELQELRDAAARGELPPPAPEPEPAPEPAEELVRTHRLKTRHHLVADMMQFCTWLHGERILREMPQRPQLPELSRDPGLRRATPTEDELQRFLAAIPEHLRGLWLMRGLDCLRPSEARRLRVRDYTPPTFAPDGAELTRGVLHIRISKTRRGLRALPVDYAVQDWLADHMPRGHQWTPDALLFQNPIAERESGAWTEDSERSVHLAAIAAAGIPYYAPNHMGRHAAATHHAERGVDIRLLQLKMGHADPRTTENVYVHQREASTLRALEQTTRARPNAPAGRSAAGRDGGQGGQRGDSR